MQKGFKLNQEFLKKKAGTDIDKRAIQKVLKQANSRIRNIQNSGLNSPALKLLEAERGEIERFSVFSVGGLNPFDKNDWGNMLDEFTRAVAFLNNPTSTVTGSRKFIKSHIQDEFGIDFDIANALMGELTEYEINGNGEINIFKYTETLKSLAEQKSDFQRTDLNTALRYVFDLGGSLLEVLQGSI